MRNKKREEQNKIEFFLKEKKACEEKIKDAMKRDAPNDQCEIGTATYAHFAECSGEQLKCFVHARKSNAGKLPRGQGIYLKKGKVEDAQTGNPCLILLAHEHKGRPVVLMRELIANDEAEARNGSVV